MANRTSVPTDTADRTSFDMLPWLEGLHEGDVLTTEDIAMARAIIAYAHDIYLPWAVSFEGLLTCLRVGDTRHSRSVLRQMERRESAA